MAINITEQKLQHKIKDKSVERAIWSGSENRVIVGEICSLLLNACRYSINANAYICADDINKAKESGEAIIEIIESFEGLKDSVFCLQSKQFLYEEWEKHVEVKNCKYIYIPDFQVVTNEEGLVDKKATENRCRDLKCKLEEIENALWKGC